MIVCQSGKEDQEFDAGNHRSTTVVRPCQNKDQFRVHTWSVLLFINIISVLKNNIQKVLFILINFNFVNEKL